jgi:hypothetical protein
VRDKFHSLRYSMDVWHGCLSMSRQYLRGWSANKNASMKRENITYWPSWRLSTKGMRIRFIILWFERKIHVGGWIGNYL